MDNQKDKDTNSEVHASFDDELTAEEKQMRAYVRMNHRRKTCKPDVDQAWKELQGRSMVPRRARRFSLWHLSAAVAVGAAAMLAVVFLFQRNMLSGSGNSSDFVALLHDRTPQCIQLDSEGEVMDLTADDSISFCAPGTSPMQSLSGSAEVKTRRLTTPRGMDFKVILPDGSEVWLNAESSIEFPSSFQSGVRQVNLEGEAYFKVTRNEHAPFIVHSNQMNIRVLGTEFNLKSYASEPTHVTLVEGKVEVMRPGSNQTDARLKPGEEAWFDDKGKLRVEQGDTYAVTQWVKGFFYFHDQPLVNVLRELGRWYNLGVIFRNTEAMNYNIHFSALRNDSVEVAVESLNSLRHIHIQIEGDDMVVY